MIRTLLAVLLLAMPIGLLSVPEGGVLWRLEQRWQAFSPVNDDTAYQARDRLDTALAADGVAMRAMLDAWRDEAARSLESPWPIALPHAETMSANGAGTSFEGATTFVFELDPERVLRIETVAAEASLGGLIVDVYDGSAQTPVASLGPAPLQERIAFDAWTEAIAPPRADAPPAAARTVRVRVQPTPGATGRFALALSSGAAFDFPVATDAERPVRSFFGVPRDGGRRQHHGIDIFAPRGTPVVAAADGVIRRTGTSRRGGLHVWQRARDDDGNPVGSLYYAHLDRIDVAAGDRVVRGTPIGAVGNTGNARSTPPHLHFGLYRRFAGPLDPLPLTGLRRDAVAPLEPGDALPDWMAIDAARANLRAGPSLDAPVLGQARNGELLAVHALDGDARWVRVTSGNGVVAWVARSLLGRVGTDGPRRRLAGEADLFAVPSRRSPVRAQLAADTGFRHGGRFGDALRIVTDDGLVGWLQERQGRGLE